MIVTKKKKGINKYKIHFYRKKKIERFEIGETDYRSKRGGVGWI